MSGAPKRGAERSLLGNASHFQHLDGDLAPAAFYEAVGEGAAGEGSGLGEPEPEQLAE